MGRLSILRKFQLSNVKYRLYFELNSITVFVLHYLVCKTPLSLFKIKNKI